MMTVAVASGKSSSICNVPELYKAFEHYNLSHGMEYTFQNMLNQLIQEFHFNLNQLTRALDISNETVKRWLRGEILKPSFKNYRKIFSLYCLSKELSNYQF